MDDYKKYDSYAYFCGLALFVLWVILFTLFISSENVITAPLIKIISFLIVFDSLGWLFIRAFIYKPLVLQVIAIIIAVVNLIFQVL